MPPLVENASGDKVALDEPVYSLEQRYTRLLEQRIAQLEAQIEEANVKTDKKDEKGELPKSPTVATSGAIGPSINGTVNQSAPEKKDDSTQTGDANARVKNMITRWDENAYEYETIEGSKATTAETGDEIKNLCTFTKVMSRENDKKVKSEEIVIESPEVKKLLLECSRRLNPASYQNGEAIRLSSPFKDFVWYHDEIAKACEHQGSDTKEKKEARDDLRQLKALVEKSSLEDYFKIRKSIASSGSISYEYVWTLFPPGEMLYSQRLAPGIMDMSMFECAGCTPPSFGSDIDPPHAIDIPCMAFDFDGVNFQKYLYYFDIKKFKAEKRIDELEVYPISFYRNEDRAYDDTKLQEDLLKRGQKFVELCAAGPKDFQRIYKGAAMTQISSGFARLTAGRNDNDTASIFSSDDDPFRGLGGQKSSATFPEMNGKVIIDNYLYLRSERVEKRYSSPPLGNDYSIPVGEGTCTCKACTTSPVRQWQPTGDRDIIRQAELFSKSDMRLKLCPPKVLGFALKQKTWAQFRVQSLSKMDTDIDGRRYFEHDLQLAQQYKDILWAFISNHESSRSIRSGSSGHKPASPSFDIIADKGKGLAILLHGAPGVGKTLTAETIALATGRPLVMVSVAEVGVEASEAEGKLGAIFADAARWEAILLMDEADVFLEAREKTENPNRNALVSVLLRCLEYYEGIIILTTNRIRSFDIAVQSRMHLAIQYDDLDMDSKLNIYKNLLMRIPEDKRASNLKNKALASKNSKLDSLCRRGKINGRQIRNVVASACAIANARKDVKDGDSDDRLNFDDLESIHEMTMDFVSSLSEDMKIARGQNELRRS